MLEVASENDEITLDFIHSEDLKQLIKYCEFHAKAVSMKTKPSDQDIANFDESFLQAITRDNRTHLRMLVNADKLSISPLFRKLVKSVADKLSGKDAETIRREWFVTKFTPLTKSQHKEIFETTDWLYPELRKKSESEV
jgi:hypothetical protein